MMLPHILLYVAVAVGGPMPGLSAPPVFVGEYPTYNACYRAMKEIYQNKIAPGSEFDPHLSMAIDTLLIHQREFYCIKKEA